MYPEQPVILWGKISDGVVRAVHVDSASHALETITDAHHEVHAGASFVCSDVQNINNTSVKWMITTPNTPSYAHMIFDIIATGEMQVIITEGADRTGTNALTEINRRRVGTPVTATVVIHRVVSGGTTDGATTIFSVRDGATNQGGKTVEAGGQRGVNEFVLKPNTKYIITVTTYTDIYVTFHADWYEHPDED